MPGSVKHPTGGFILAAEVTPIISPQLNAPATSGMPQSGQPGQAGQPDGTAPELGDSSPKLSPQDAVDFLLHPVEVARGRTAAENYLGSCRSEESRRFAEEALETLATVISGGRCDSLGFPWQQVKPFHGAAALTILKEKGAPARIEALRCRRDTTRSYRVVPESYPPGQMQKIRTTLSKVIAECSELGFVSAAEEDAEDVENKTKKTKSTARGRLLGDGELRALAAASTASANAEGRRDAVFFALVNRGLKIAEINGLSMESVRFSNKTGACSIVSTTPSGGNRGRRVELTNGELIGLEDWLDDRGDKDGPLLCTLGRGGKVEGKRLTMGILKEVCERRAKQAEVADFVPNDLSRSADSLTEHRKAARKKAAKKAQDEPTNAEQALFDHSVDASAAGEAICFPFQGLGI
jgi:integrase